MPDILPFPVEAVRMPAPGQRGVQARSGAREKLVELKAWLADRQSVAPAPSDEAAPAFGIEALDTLLPGGLPRGALVELVEAAPAAGAGFALSRLLASATELGWRPGLVDAHDRFDPQSHTERLLAALVWVRMRDTLSALRAADTLARDGNLPLLALDLRDAPPSELRPLNAATWFRLQRTLEATPVRLLALTARPLVSSAVLRIVLDQPLSLQQLDAPPGELCRSLAPTLARARRVSP